MKFYMLFLVLWLISGCASKVPKLISQEPVPDIRITDVMPRTEAFNGRNVRWGGSILTVTNRPGDTEIEILARRLNRSGRPVEGDETQGRFLARVSGFLDPAVYAQGRLLTVYGTVAGSLSKPIGEKPYTYVKVEAQTLYLWPPEPVYAYPAYPYDYYPPYGYGFYPYRRRIGFGFGYGRFGW